MLTKLGPWKNSIILFLVALLLMGLTGCEGQDLEEADLSFLLEEDERAPAPEPVRTGQKTFSSLPDPDTETMTITLHCIFQGREHLVEREIPRTQAVARALVEDLYRGFTFEGKNYPVVPRGTRLLDINIIDKIAYLDFSREFRDNHWGGVEAEINTIYSIVQTLTQFPQVEAVQFLIEGRQINTIAAGALDLSEPVWPLDRITPKLYEEHREKTKESVAGTLTWSQLVQEEGVIALPAGEPDDLAWGDLTGDGSPELVVAKGKQVAVWAVEGEGYHQVWETRLAAPGKLLLGDTTGNGQAEVIAFTDSDIYIFALGEDGYRQLGWQGVTGQIASLAVGDTTGNGREELILLYGEGDPLSDNYAAVAEIWQYGGGGYVKAFGVEEMPYRRMEVVDLTGDGRREVIAFAREGLTVFTWNGKAYVEIYKNPGIGGYYSALTLGDLTGDGRAEVILGDGLGQGIYIYTWEGEGLRKIWQADGIPGDVMASPLLARDLDGDGREELLVPTRSDGEYRVLAWDGSSLDHYAVEGGQGERIVAVLSGRDGSLLFSRRQLAGSPRYQVYLGRWRRQEFATRGG